MKRKELKHILGIDIGGSGIKAALINDRGRMISKRHRIETPQPSTPSAILKTIKKLAGSFKGYNRVAIGFPGLVRDGLVYTAPNLGNKNWHKIPLAKRVSKLLNAPTRLINDAEMQGLAVIKGKGMELVVTLGTGFGIAIYKDGRPIPHLELSQHPVRNNQTYDEYVGNDARQSMPKKKWIKRINRVLKVLHVVVNYDSLYVGGGNAKRIDQPLKYKARIVSNQAGIIGGAALWKLKDWS